MTVVESAVARAHHQVSEHPLLYLAEVLAALCPLWRGKPEPPNTYLEAPRNPTALSSNSSQCYRYHQAALCNNMHLETPKSRILYLLKPAVYLLQKYVDVCSWLAPPHLPSSFISSAIYTSLRTCDVAVLAVLAITQVAQLQYPTPKSPVLWGRCLSRPLSPRLRPLRRC